MHPCPLGLIQGLHTMVATHMYGTTPGARAAKLLLVDQI